MGKHSQLGPIDPQMVTPDGQHHPARSILLQFDQAKAEIAADPSALSAWLPILQGYGPSMLQECERAEALSRSLVKQWLRAYMLRADPRRAAKARAIANWFWEYGASQSHALGIGRDEARARGLHVTDLEANQALQDAVLSVHHATIHTFSGQAAKIVENHLGRAWVEMTMQVMMVQGPQGGPPAGGAPAAPPRGGPPRHGGSPVTPPGAQN